MDPQLAGQAAELLWRAWRNGDLLDGLPDPCRPRNLAEGYAIQEAIAAGYGGASIGWKIAATSQEGQQHINVTEPICGRLFARFLREDGARLDAKPLHMRVAEAEFAFRLGRDLPPRPEGYSREKVVETVDGLHLAIEVPDSRYRDFTVVGAPQLIADDACAALFVLGPEVTGWRGLDLSSQPVTGVRNGTVVARGSGAKALGDPWIALTWIANDRAKLGQGLRAGEIVTTGTCIQPVAVSPGDEVIADFGELGTVRVSF